MPPISTSGKDRWVTPSEPFWPRHCTASGFVAVSARVAGRAERGMVAAGDIPAKGVRVTARLWGGRLPPRQGSRLTEVKAVTYHRLTVAQTPGGEWRATVLFDV